MKKQNGKVEANGKSSPEDQRTPFERFAEFARRIVRVPKSEIPKEKWSKEHPHADS